MSIPLVKFDQKLEIEFPTFLNHDVFGEVGVPEGVDGGVATFLPEENQFEGESFFAPLHIFSKNLPPKYRHPTANVPFNKVFHNGTGCCRF